MASDETAGCRAHVLLADGGVLTCSLPAWHAASSPPNHNHWCLRATDNGASVGLLWSMELPTVAEFVASGLVTEATAPSREA